MNRLLTEIIKNFKLIFRNWSSLVLIILAPLFLILLVGYSFSGETLHDINIGVIADSKTNIDLFTKNISSFAQVTRYPSLGSCLLDLKDENAHLCVEIKGTLQTSDGKIPQGEIKVHYDNTRKRVSLLLLSQIKEYFGLTAQEISLISTQTI